MKDFVFRVQGLGRNFLRHLRRTRLLVHVVDAATENPINDYRTVREVCILPFMIEYIFYPFRLGCFIGSTALFEVVGYSFYNQLEGSLLRKLILLSLINFVLKTIYL